jgi:hypothetical protein
MGKVLGPEPGESATLNTVHGSPKNIRCTMAGDAAEQDTPSEIGVCARAQGRSSRLPRAVAYSALASPSFDELIVDQCDRNRSRLTF